MFSKCFVFAGLGAGCNSYNGNFTGEESIAHWPSKNRTKITHGSSMDEKGYKLVESAIDVWNRLAIVWEGTRKPLSMQFVCLNC